jgi:hypothetical protein
MNKPQLPVNFKSQNKITWSNMTSNGSRVDLPNTVQWIAETLDALYVETQGEFGVQKPYKSSNRTK